ncbi:hypothetical protein CHS0354_005861, partial [Potamilus streckersoni]
MDSCTTTPFLRKNSGKRTRSRITHRWPTLPDPSINFRKKPVHENMAVSKFPVDAIRFIKTKILHLTKSPKGHQSYSGGDDVDDSGSDDAAVTDVDINVRVLLILPKMT